MIKAIFPILVAVSLLGCTKPDDARRLLASQGYQDIKITSYRWASCSEDDTYKTGFIAKSVSGEYVSGAVCSGFFLKGSTIRFD